MKAPIYKIRNIIDVLQDIVDEADSRGITEIATSCNTYGLNSFICLNYDGYLDLNADIDELFDDKMD